MARGSIRIVSSGVALVFLSLYEVSGFWLCDQLATLHRQPSFMIFERKIPGRLDQVSWRAKVYFWGHMSEQEPRITGRGSGSTSIRNFRNVVFQEIRSQTCLLSRSLHKPPLSVPSVYGLYLSSLLLFTDRESQWALECSCFRPNLFYICSSAWYTAGTIPT